MTAIIPGTAGYAEHADELALRYESITFAQVHRDVIHLFPQAPSAVLDIGAGTGRDAAALARLGHAVTAVEPTAELRRAGQQRHAGLAIEWVDDHLPALAGLRAGQRRFELMLLTAVWMHLDAEARVAAMASVVSLLAPEGQIVMSLRHGPVPEGRTMFEVSAQETTQLAAARGLRAHHFSERGDMLGRDDVRWSILGLSRRDSIR